MALPAACIFPNPGRASDEKEVIWRKFTAEFVGGSVFCCWDFLPFSAFWEKGIFRLYSSNEIVIDYGVTIMRIMTVIAFLQIMRVVFFWLSAWCWRYQICRMDFFAWGDACPPLLRLGFYATP